MDDLTQPAEGTNSPLQEPQLHQPGADDGDAFVPLRLIVQPGGLAVELIRPEMVVGRNSVADIRLRLPDVSRRHCRFVFAAGRWQVFDLNSLNGLFVNGVRVQQATLQNRDMIRIGSYTFEAEVRAPGTLRMPGSRTAESILGSIADALPKQPVEPGVQKKQAS